MKRHAATLAVLLVGACTWPACTLDFDIPGEIEQSCKATDPCSCASGNSCNFSCGSSACTPKCAAGSSCAIDCGSGGCAATCEKDAVCEVDCGSGACTIQCDGKCKVDCGSGKCVCTGAGCP